MLAEINRFYGTILFSMTAAPLRSLYIVSSIPCAVKLFVCFFLEVPPRFELGMEVLQTFALPLGYGTLYGAEDGIRTRDPRLGKAMLYH